MMRARRPSETDAFSAAAVVVVVHVEEEPDGRPSPDHRRPKTENRKPSTPYSTLTEMVLANFLPKDLCLASANCRVRVCGPGSSSTVASFCALP